MNKYKIIYDVIKKYKQGINPYVNFFNRKENLLFGRLNFIQTIECRYLIDVNMVNIIFLLYVINLIKSIKKYDKNTLYKYISFTRFSDGFLKISCDWCSIVNGVFALLMDTIYYSINDKNYNKLLTVDFSLLLISLQFQIFTQSLLSSSKLSIVPNDKLMKKYIIKINKLHTNSKNKHKLKKNINKLLSAINLFEYIEQKWCPFKHIVKINYKKKHHYYNANNLRELMIAKKILKKHGNITCNNCVKILNRSNKFNNNDKSIFDDFMKLLNYELCS